MYLGLRFASLTSVHYIERSGQLRVSFVYNRNYNDDTRSISTVQYIVINLITELSCTLVLELAVPYLLQARPELEPSVNHTVYCTYVRYRNCSPHCVH